MNMLQLVQDKKNVINLTLFNQVIYFPLKTWPQTPYWLLSRQIWPSHFVLPLMTTWLTHTLMMAKIILDQNLQYLILLIINQFLVTTTTSFISFLLSWTDCTCYLKNH